MAEINLKTLTTGGGVTDIDVNFNGTLEGQADATIPLNVNLTDGTNPVTPTSVALTGNDLDIEIPTLVVPSGVLFQTIEPSQYTSYRTGDEGWRVQNGFFDYTPPISPKVVAELDYSLGANYWARLKNDLVVGGVANKLRFVDVDGGQTFSSTGNKNLITIDKLTGLGFTRTNVGNAANWNTAIDNALTYSIVVNGVTYNDFYLYCLNEGISFFGTGRTNQNLIDPITLVNLQSASNAASVLFTSTTNEINTAQMYNLENVNFIRLEAKAGVTRQLYVFDARNLITAP